MAAICPGCHRDIDPFVAHMCGAPDWSPRLTPSSTAVVQGLIVHPDSRGNVRETFRASWFPQVPTIKQLVRSESRPKTLRGMHLHRKQWDVWTFVAGSALVRLRYPDGEEQFIYTSQNNPITIAIPPGVSHGFYTWEGCTLLYALTEEYDGTDEYGWFPMDGNPTHPGWPTSHVGIVISERDVRAPRLADFEASPHE